jgi:hypothetical protein
MTEENKTVLKLIDRAEVSKVLAPTEGLTFTDIKPGKNFKVQFRGTKDEPVVDLGESELRVHPDGLFDAGQCIGLPKNTLENVQQNCYLIA